MISAVPADSVPLAHEVSVVVTRRMAGVVGHSRTDSRTAAQRRAAPAGRTDPCRGTRRARVRVPPDARRAVLGRGRRPSRRLRRGEKPLGGLVSRRDLTGGRRGGEQGRETAALGAVEPVFQPSQEAVAQSFVFGPYAQLASLRRRLSASVSAQTAQRVGERVVVRPSTTPRSPSSRASGLRCAKSLRAVA